MRSAVAPSDDVIARRETPCTADPLPCAAAAASSLPQISARSSLISSTDSSTSQSSSSACGTSSVNRHAGRPGNPRRRPVSSSPRCAAGFPRGIAMRRNADGSRYPRCPSRARCKMAGLQGFEYGVRSAWRRRRGPRRRRARNRRAIRPPRARLRPAGMEARASAYRSHRSRNSDSTRVVHHGERNILAMLPRAFEAGEAHIVFHVGFARNDARNEPSGVSTGSISTSVVVFDPVPITMFRSSKDSPMPTQKRSSVSR